MIKLLADPLTRVSLHDISYTSNDLKWGREWWQRVRGKQKFDDRMNRISTEGRKTLFNPPVILAKNLKCIVSNIDSMLLH